MRKPFDHEETLEPDISKSLSSCCPRKFPWKTPCRRPPSFYPCSVTGYASDTSLHSSFEKKTQPFYSPRGLPYFVCVSPSGETIVPFEGKKPDSSYRIQPLASMYNVKSENADLKSLQEPLSVKEAVKQACYNRIMESTIADTSDEASAVGTEESETVQACETSLKTSESELEETDCTENVEEEQVEEGEEEESANIRLECPRERIISVYYMPTTETGSPFRQNRFAYNISHNSSRMQPLQPHDYQNEMMKRGYSPSYYKSPPSIPDPRAMQGPPQVPSPRSMQAPASVARPLQGRAMTPNFRPMPGPQRPPSPGNYRREIPQYMQQNAYPEFYRPHETVVQQKQLPSQEYPYMSNSESYGSSADERSVNYYPRRIGNYEPRPGPSYERRGAVSSHQRMPYPPQDYDPRSYPKEYMFRMDPKMVLEQERRRRMHQASLDRQNQMDYFSGKQRELSKGSSNNSGSFVRASYLPPSESKRYVENYPSENTVQEGVIPMNFIKPVYSNSTLSIHDQGSLMDPGSQIEKLEELIDRRGQNDVFKESTLILEDQRSDHFEDSPPCLTSENLTSETLPVLQNASSTTSANLTSETLPVLQIASLKSQVEKRAINPVNLTFANVQLKNDDSRTINQPCLTAQPEKQEDSLATQAARQETVNSLPVATELSTKVVSKEEVVVHSDKQRDETVIQEKPNLVQEHGEPVAQYEDLPITPKAEIPLIQQHSEENLKELAEQIEPAVRSNSPVASNNSSQLSFDERPIKPLVVSPPENLEETFPEDEKPPVVPKTPMSSCRKRTPSPALRQKDQPVSKTSVPGRSSTSRRTPSPALRQKGPVRSKTSVSGKSSTSRRTPSPTLREKDPLESKTSVTGKSSRGRKTPSPTVRQKSPVDTINPKVRRPSQSPSIIRQNTPLGSRTSTLEKSDENKSPSPCSVSRVTLESKSRLCSTTSMTNRRSDLTPVEKSIYPIMAVSSKQRSAMCSRSSLASSRTASVNPITNKISPVLTSKVVDKRRSPVSSPKSPSSNDAKKRPESPKPQDEQNDQQYTDQEKIKEPEEVKKKESLSSLISPSEAQKAISADIKYSKLPPHERKKDWSPKIPVHQRRRSPSLTSRLPTKVRRPSSESPQKEGSIRTRREVTSAKEKLETSHKSTGTLSPKCSSTPSASGGIASGTQKYLISPASSFTNHNQSSFNQTVKNNSSLELTSDNLTTSSGVLNSYDRPGYNLGSISDHSKNKNDQTHLKGAGSGGRGSCQGCPCPSPPIGQGRGASKSCYENIFRRSSQGSSDGNDDKKQVGGCHCASESSNESSLSTSTRSTTEAKKNENENNEPIYQENDSTDPENKQLEAIVYPVRISSTKHFHEYLNDEGAADRRGAVSKYSNYPTTEKYSYPNTERSRRVKSPADLSAMHNIHADPFGYGNIFKKSSDPLLMKEVKRSTSQNTVPKIMINEMTDKMSRSYLEIEEKFAGSNGILDKKIIVDEAVGDANKLLQLADRGTDEMSAFRMDFIVDLNKERAFDNTPTRSQSDAFDSKTKEKDAFADRPTESRTKLTIKTSGKFDHKPRDSISNLFAKKSDKFDKPQIQFDAYPIANKPDLGAINIIVIENDKRKKSGENLVPAAAPAQTQLEVQDATFSSQKICNHKVVEQDNGAMSASCNLIDKLPPPLEQLDNPPKYDPNEGVCSKVAQRTSSRDLLSCASSSSSLSVVDVRHKHSKRSSRRDTSGKGGRKHSRERKHREPTPKTSKTVTVYKKKQLDAVGDEGERRHRHRSHSKKLERDQKRSRSRSPTRSGEEADVSTFQKMIRCCMAILTFLRNYPFRYILRYLLFM